MTFEEYEDALNKEWGGSLLCKRFLDQLSRAASEELGEPVYIERVSVADRRALANL